MSDPLRWSCILLRALYREGVCHIYISPGSRSTPLLLAAVTHPGFTCYSILDERSAAFQALGHAKRSGRPAVMICTSGTALANVHPAMIEARESGTPFILLSADRPPHLRGTGSSQTIDQIKLFGDTPLLFHELGEPAEAQEDIRRLELLARQAVSVSTDPGGPVHLNAPFRKPLEPSPERLSEEITASRKAFKENPVNGDEDGLNRFPPNHPDGAGKDRTDHKGACSLPASVIDKLNRARRPLVIAGPESASRSRPGTARVISSRLNAPLIAEPGSHEEGCRQAIHRYDLLMRSERADLFRPDLVIRTGDTPYSKVLQNFLTHEQEIPVIQFLQRDSWQQHSFRVDHRIVLGGSLPDLDDIKPAEPSWRKMWEEADNQADKRLDSQLDKAQPLTDLHAIRHLFSQVDQNWEVMLSNSFTIRDYALARPRDSNPVVYSNRGAAGIDGILSTGFGIAQTTGRPLVILTGDLAFLHDSNALLSLKTLEAGLAAGQLIRIVILNNGGGTIFRMLPIRQTAGDYYKEWFETPQHVDIKYLAAAHGIPFSQLCTREELTDYSITDRNSGIEIIECVTDADATMTLREELWMRHGETK